MPILGIPQLEQDGNFGKGARINVRSELLHDTQIIRNDTFIFLNQNKSGPCSCGPRCRESQEQLLGGCISPDVLQSLGGAPQLSVSSVGRRRLPKCPEGAASRAVLEGSILIQPLQVVCVCMWGSTSVCVRVCVWGGFRLSSSCNTICIDPF